MAETHADLIDHRAGDLISAVAAESDDVLVAALEADFRQMSAAQGRFVVRLGEVARRQWFRDEGATSTQAWAVERFGVGVATARAYAQVAEKAPEVPGLMGSLCEGEVSLDKVRAVLEVATPLNEGHLCDVAKGCGVAELADIARRAAERPGAPGPVRGRSAHERRYLRFNDTVRTVSAQLPPEAYAQAKACLEARARQIPSEDGVASEDKVAGGDGNPSEDRARWDQRLCDAFVELMAPGSPTGSAAASPFVVVAHVALEALVHDTGEVTELAGELEHDGLISTEVVKELACDATLVVALDDEVGHTMYEGRARRFPSGAQRREVMRRDRHCRFPGCANVTFADVHHIVAWKPRGRTDLDNLALLCRHHHGVVHRKGWTMSGNANEELSFLGPSGRVMTSRPSPLWARVTAGRRSGGSG